MLVPLYGFVEGDTIGLLVLAHDDMSIETLTRRLREAARTRVGTLGPARILFGERALEPELTVAEAGLQALDRIDLRFGGEAS